MTAAPCAPTGPVHPRVRDLAAGSGPLLVRGAGGTGKTRLLAELAGAWARTGVTVLDGRAGDVDLPAGEFAVVVDDAHRLTQEVADRLRPLLRHPHGRVVLAFRPWPRPAPLAALLAEMGADRRSVLLGPADRAQVADWARERLGTAATRTLVDAVAVQAGGLPGLTLALLAALASRRAVHGAAEPLRGAVPEEVAARVRADLDAVDDDTRGLLHAVAAGAPVDDEVLGGVLGIPAERAAELLTAARATGLLQGGGAVVPLVASVLLGSVPPDVTRRTRRRLLGLLLDRGEEPLELARRLAAGRVRDPRAADLLERYGDAALAADPVLAGELWSEAVDAGAPAAALATRRAQAAALTGDLDGALQWADVALADPAAADRPRAAGVTATVLAQRGLLTRAAELYRLAGRERAGSAALALLATGAADEAAAVLEGPGSGLGLASVLSVGEELMAQGVVQSLRTGAEAADGIAAALSTLTRSAALLEPLGRAALLPDTPAALAALVGLHSGELPVAESVLQRAVAADLGGPSSRPRHLLLLAWIAMLAGRMTRARDLLAQAREAAAGPLEPRDDVFLQGLEVGLARRDGDAAALVGAWVRAREAVVRHPVDLFTLLPLGELVVAAARLRDGERLRSQLTAAQTLLRRLGDPQLWAVPLHWSGAQAAIIAEDRDGLRPHAAALVAAARTSPYAATLARAGRTWLQVLSDEIDPAAVVATAEELTAVGLGWDGSRLAGQAAARVTDLRARAVLLACARSVAEGAGCEPAAPATDPEGTPAPGVPAPRGQLSDREREVARLVVAGQTYREIGGQLYISAKTVEHHVSRMRQRLGAGTRSDLLARLRAELAQGA
ncbi:LuxR C-terminal-related transcriptional regulator [Geodermatophilus sp. SYSU D00700]